MTAPEGAVTGAAQGMQLSCGYNTDRGLRRELNEDSFLAADPVFAVADGMGGHEAGEIASRECIRTLGESPALTAGNRSATATDLQVALQSADARIRELTDSRAGTTVSGVVVVEERGVPYWLVFNVGDSRTYRLSQGRFEQVSVDHSEVQEMVDAGYITAEQALVHPRRHVVTRALGTGDDTEADYWLVPIEDGDRFMVCSDGLTAEVDDGHIHRILSTSGHPQDAVDSLVQAALRSGGRDNVTVLVIDASNVGEQGTLPDTAPRTSSIPLDENTLPRHDAGNQAIPLAAEAGPAAGSRLAAGSGDLPDHVPDNEDTFDRNDPMVPVPLAELNAGRAQATEEQALGTTIPLDELLTAADQNGAGAEGANGGDNASGDGGENA